MASQDDSAGAGLGPEPEHNPYSSASRWRHQESSSFHRHAGSQARDPVGAGTTGPLASFLKSSRVEPESDGSGGVGGHHQPITVVAAADATRDGAADEPARDATRDGREVVCGPLLNYRRMDEGRWYGSVLVVVDGGGKEVLYQPSLVLRRVGHGGQPASADGGAASPEARLESQRLYSDKRNTFWAFDIDVPLEPVEAEYEYEIPHVRFASEDKPRVNSFFVPAADESMRIMFHSCNGFSVGTDEEAFSGTPLWKNVMRRHAQAPFHVMVGGGDQIYNDGIRVNGPLRLWTDIGNPKKRREYPFPEALRAKCDDYYLQNYIRWYNTAPFAHANGQIPQINMWDDHDVCGVLLPMQARAPRS